MASTAEARKVVAELRELAAAVAEPVRELTGLPGSADDGNVAVVDRPGWIRANVDGFRVVLDPLVQRMAEQDWLELLDAVRRRIDRRRLRPEEEGRVKQSIRERFPEAPLD